jgi:hypothetical protein
VEGHEGVVRAHVAPQEVRGNLGGPGRRGGRDDAPAPPAPLDAGEVVVVAAAAALAAITGRRRPPQPPRLVVDGPKVRRTKRREDLDGGDGDGGRLARAPLRLRVTKRRRAAAALSALAAALTSALTSSLTLTSPNHIVPVQRDGRRGGARGRRLQGRDLVPPHNLRKRAEAVGRPPRVQNGVAAEGFDGGGDERGRGGRGAHVRLEQDGGRPARLRRRRRRLVRGVVLVRQGRDAALVGLVHVPAGRVRGGGEAREARQSRGGDVPPVNVPPGGREEGREKVGAEEGVGKVAEGPAAVVAVAVAVNPGLDPPPNRLRNSREGAGNVGRVHPGGPRQVRLRGRLRLGHLEAREGLREAAGQGVGGGMGGGREAARKAKGEAPAAPREVAAQDGRKQAQDGVLLAPAEPAEARSRGAGSYGRSRSRRRSSRICCTSSSGPRPRPSLPQRADAAPAVVGALVARPSEREAVGAVGAVARVGALVDAEDGAAPRAAVRVARRHGEAARKAPVLAARAAPRPRRDVVAVVAARVDPRGAAVGAALRGAEDGGRDGDGRPEVSEDDGGGAGRGKVGAAEADVPGLGEALLLLLLFLLLFRFGPVFPPRRRLRRRGR